MNETTTNQEKPRQRAAGDTITLAPADRATLLLACQEYRDGLQRKMKAYRHKNPAVFDTYVRLSNELDRAQKAIT